jgi:hypothetical protein
MTTPPDIIHETRPSDPANEWVAKTTASPSPNSGTNSTTKFDDTKESAGTTALTQGPDFPGAYPGDIDATDAFTAGDAKNAAIGVLHTAKQFIPTQEDVEKAMLNASEKAKQYLPSAVSSYFRTKLSLPFRTSLLPFIAIASATSHSNVVGKGESTGVGDLPGGDDEISIAKLPDERNDRCKHLLQLQVT